MGDCGAFTYVREEVPPYSVSDVIQFYADCGFDFGISPDHVILEFSRSWYQMLAGLDEPPESVRHRQDITLALAREFLEETTRLGTRFVPIGVAQGWSPKSYAKAVSELQRMGYRYIALGGLVPLKTPDILATLEGVASNRAPGTLLHLLGVTRTDHLSSFGQYGVISFDNTSPLRQAFKDEKDNYWTLDRTFSAIRVPQVEGNPRLQRQIAAGQVRQDEAQRLEKAALGALQRFDNGNASLGDVLTALQDYEVLYAPGESHTKVYREVLEASPWKTCGCDVCNQLGYHVILFRGADRNRRRGFHNLWVFYRRLRRELGNVPDAPAISAGVKEAGVIA
jgi:hypothetical protein